MKPERFFEYDEVAGFIEVPSQFGPPMDPWDLLYVECAGCPTLTPWGIETLRRKQGVQGRRTINTSAGPRLLCHECAEATRNAEYEASR